MGFLLASLFGKLRKYLCTKACLCEEMRFF